MAQAEFPIKTPEQARFALFVFLGGLVVGLIYQVQLWTLDENGFSVMSERLPYWDFTNLWAGSKLAVEGRVGDLFDVEAYRAALRAMFSPLLPNQEWSYPPNILLIGAPLAALPIFAAYSIWTAGSIALLHVAIKPMGLPLPVHLAATFSPPVFMNAMFGQNGSVTAALLIGGLLLAPKRPIVAGALFGLLTIKPHLGILVPFCLLASWNWRAIISAGVTTIVIAAVTGLVFGFQVWPDFINQTGPLMTKIMEAPYPQTYHANAITIFIMARSLGLGLTGSYLVQAAATLTAIVAVTWLWRPSNPIDHRQRAVATASLAILATPYGYSYDTVPMCLALAWIYATSRQPKLALLSIAWLFPMSVHMLNYKGIGIGVLVPAAVSAYLLWKARSDQRPVGRRLRTNTVVPASR